MSVATPTSAMETLSEDEIQRSFNELGLAGVAPTGYQYISSPVMPARVFDVVRTSHSGPRG